MQNERILITGGSGFLGSNLALALCDKNEILVWDILTWDSQRFKPVQIKEQPTDILDYLDVSSKISAFKPTIILHCASIVGIHTVIQDPIKTIETITFGTRNLLEVCRYNKDLKHFLNFSTTEIYGQQACFPTEDCITEIGPAGIKRWSYAASKVVSEHLVMAYYHQFKIPITNIRPCNIYGIGQRQGVGAEGAINIFIQQALQNNPITIAGGAQNRIRSWCYISDFIDGVMLILSDRIKSIGQTYNIGNSQEIYTIYKLAKIIKTLIPKCSSEIVIGINSVPDINLRIPSIEKMKFHFKFQPKINLTQGIKKHIQYIKDYNENNLC